MSWEEKYKYGTLLLLPPDDVSVCVNALRAKYDPSSQRICLAHITLTQPLLKKPDRKNIERLKILAKKINRFAIEYGPLRNLGKGASSSI